MTNQELQRIESRITEVTEKIEQELDNRINADNPLDEQLCSAKIAGYNSEIDRLELLKSKYE